MRGERRGPPRGSVPPLSPRAGTRRGAPGCAGTRRSGAGRVRVPLGALFSVCVPISVPEEQTGKWFSAVSLQLANTAHISAAVVAQLSPSGGRGAGSAAHPQRCHEPMVELCFSCGLCGFLCCVPCRSDKPARISLIPVRNRPLGDPKGRRTRCHRESPNARVMHRARSSQAAGKPPRFP